MEKYLSKKSKYTLIILFIFILLDLCIFLPWGHDSNFHVMRLGQEATLIKDNGVFNLPYYIYPDVYGGYGYGSPMFYCDLFFIPFACIASLGIDTIFCYKLLVGFIAILAFFISYLSVYEWKHDKELSLVCAILYTLQPYFLLDLFTRSAIGESLALCFEPLVVYGIYAIFSSDKSIYVKGIFFLGIGLGLCLLSHLISSFLIVISLIIVCMCMIKKIIHTPSILLRLLISAIICLGFTCWFWAPMAEQLFSVQFKAFEYNDYFLSNVMNLKELLIPYKFLYKLSSNPDSLNWFIGGAIVLPFCIIILATKNKLWNYSRTVLAFIGVIILITIIMVSKPVCAFLYPLIGNIRLPWRLMIIATICTMLLSILLIVNCPKKYIAKTIIILTMIVSCYTMSYQMLSSTLHTIAPSVFPPSNEVITYSDKNGDDLYLPVQVDTDYIDKRGLTVSSNYIDCFVQFRNDKYTVDVTIPDNNHNNLILEFPRIYYPGYTIKTESETLRGKMSSNGLVEIQLPAMYSGNVTLSYTRTIIQKTSKIISFVVILSLIGYVTSKKFLFKRKEFQS